MFTILIYALEMMEMSLLNDHNKKIRANTLLYLDYFLVGTVRPAT